MRRPHAMRVVLRTVLAVATIPALCSTPARAQDTDIVILDNGDRITGEVKNLSRGYLAYSTNDLGTVKIEWLKLRSVQSTKEFQMALADGRLLFGSLAPGLTNDQLRVVTPEDTIDVLKINVAGITRLKESFWNRIDGSVAVGFSLTQENSKLDLNLTTQVSYLVAKNKLAGKGNGIFSTQDDANNIRQAYASLSYVRDLSRGWFLTSSLYVATNSQLSLAFRNSLGAGGGRHLVETNKVDLSIWAGFGASRERFDDQESDSTFEGIIGADFALFTFGNKESNISTSAALIPVLSQWGRIRFALTAHARQEIVNNFYLNVAITENYDSQPPTQGTNRNALSLTTSIGVSF